MKAASQRGYKPATPTDCTNLSTQKKGGNERVYIARYSAINSNKKIQKMGLVFALRGHLTKFHTAIWDRMRLSKHIPKIFLTDF